MPNTKQAAKRLRQDERRRVANRAASSRMKTEIKKVEATIAEGDKAGAEKQMAQAFKRIDKAAKAGVIHANNAARKKSRLARLLARSS